MQGITNERKNGMFYLSHSVMSVCKLKIIFEFTMCKNALLANLYRFQDVYFEDTASPILLWVMWVIGSRPISGESLYCRVCDLKAFFYYKLFKSGFVNSVLLTIPCLCQVSFTVFI